MHSTIWAEACRLYERTPINLQHDLIEYASTGGYVHVDSACILIGRSIGDGWYVQAAIGVGAMQKFIELMPYHLPYIGWRREGKHNQECVWYRTDTVIRKIKQYARRNANSSETTRTSHEG